MDLITLNDDEPSSYPTDDLESNDLLRSIFNSNDRSNSGFISLEDFLTITKDNWPDNSLNEKKLKNLVDYLDPTQSGKINYTQFIDGIRYMTKSGDQTDSVPVRTDKTVAKNKNLFLITTIDDMDLNSNGSSNETFYEYDAYTDTDTTSASNRLANNTKTNTESSLHDIDDFFNVPVIQHNQQSNTEQYLEDFGTFGTSDDSLNGDASRLESHTTTNIKSNLLKKRASGLFTNNMLSTNESGFGSESATSNNDNCIEELEQKIRDLENHVDKLNTEKKEDEENFFRLQNENYKLNQKINELEDMHQDYEKNFRFTMEVERERFNNYLTNLKTSFNEEKENFLTQINKNEVQIQQYKDEALKYIREINELNKMGNMIFKQVDENGTRVGQLEEQLVNLKNDNQRVIKERNLYKDDNDASKLKYNQTIDILTKELNNLRSVPQQQNKKRGLTISNEEINSSLNRIKDLEAELDTTKSEYRQSQMHIQDLNAQLLRKNLDAGQILLTVSNEPSLAAEMETFSKEKLMDKLKVEQNINMRYKEYIEQLLVDIMEKNPAMLEVKQIPSSNAKPMAKQDQKILQKSKATVATITSKNSVQFSKK